MHALVLSLLFELASCTYSCVCMTNVLLYFGGYINFPPCYRNLPNTPLKYCVVQDGDFRAVRDARGGAVDEPLGVRAAAALRDGG